MQTYTGAPHEFNPMFGFRVAVANPDGNMDTFYGDYKCVSKTSSGSRSSGEAAKSIEDFVLITLVKGKCTVETKMHTPYLCPQKKIHLLYFLPFFKT